MGQYGLRVILYLIERDNCLLFALVFLLYYQTCIYVNTLLLHNYALVAYVMFCSLTIGTWQEQFVL